MAEILLLEPNKLLGSQYASALEKVGHKVTNFSDAQIAIAAVDKKNPDLIIMEPLLVSHSGMEFLYELRTYPEWQNIPVIILSRVTSDGLGLTAKSQNQLGIFAHLYKPETSLNKLLKIVKEAVFSETT